MKLTHKAVAMMCGFNVRESTYYDDIAYYWYNSATNERGNLLYTENSAWEAACTDNDLIERD